MQTPPEASESVPDAPEHVTQLSYAGREIHIIGTAHVSQASVDEVTTVIRRLRPDTVCVELDQGRYEALVDKDRYKKLNLAQTIREGKQLFVLSSLLLTSMQRRMADKLGVKPGAELLAAVTTAKEVGAQLILADREVAITLKRCWSKLGTANRAQLLLTLGVSLFAKVEISAEQVEQLKGKDTMGELMKEFATHMPELQLPLIEERDRYLMSHAREAPGNVIVAVVGAAHVPGMVAVLEQPVDRAKLNEVPAPTTWSKLKPWVIPLIVIGNVLMAHALGRDPSPNDLARAWVVPCSVAATLGALLGGASPFTLLGTLLTAPFVALNPSARKAQVASWMEALWRRPSEEDRSRLDAALSKLRDLRHNPFARVLFVALGTQLGTVLGALVGCVWVLLVCWG